MFRRLRESLSRSRRALSDEISASLFDRIDEQTWERLEEALILADVGAPTTAEVVGGLEREVESGAVGADGSAIRQRLIEMLAEIAATGERRIDLSGEPAVLLMVGVNGTGKTTTIGKIAWHLSNEFGLGVVLGAADTYRAAAAEQLAEWAERAGADLVRSAAGADPGAVAFDSIAAARARSADVVIVDTAGRLHTQGNLMDELAKVRRVIGKQIPEAPHETLITIDATTGQNGLRQAKVFSDAVADRRGGPDQARRHSEGWDHPGDRRRARYPGEADRHRRGVGGPEAVRPAGVLKRPLGRVAFSVPARC